ncbi:MAG TPA: type 2 isopentenyl-diphosphate Delta-isomerase [Mesorhizobium sp.]|nr:type 2 isopentenyl-diphosphate Delta-isomerase [Mesorhizobium sp.]
MDRQEDRAGLRARKDDHLDLVLAGAGHVDGVTSGFDVLRFEHCALPELDLRGIDLSTEWLGRRLKAPLLISSMTGGPHRAETINRHLAEAAEELGIAFAVGSQRIALEGAGMGGLNHALRLAARSVPLLSNIGAAQIAGKNGQALARRAVEALGADALIVHLNPLQEALQPEGDTDWRGVLAGIERLTKALTVPVAVKEVGAGLSAAVAQRLWDAGVRHLDVAGAGGTSWAAVEAGRARSEEARRVALAFADWGLPTASAIRVVRAALPEASLVGSGGIRDGVDAAKAIRLGADIVGQAAGTLSAALHSTEAVVAHFRVAIEQLRVACFATGSPDLAALRRARLQDEPGVAP